VGLSHASERVAVGVPRRREAIAVAAAVVARLPALQPFDVEALAQLPLRAVVAAAEADFHGVRVAVRVMGQRPDHASLDQAAVAPGIVRGVKHGVEH
jgi:hypothetical protein